MPGESSKCTSIYFSNSLSGAVGLGTRLATPDHNLLCDAVRARLRKKRKMVTWLTMSQSPVPRRRPYRVHECILPGCALAVAITSGAWVRR
jgi:hypothetical protein